MRHRAARLWVALSSSRRCHRVPSSRDQGAATWRRRERRSQPDATAGTSDAGRTPLAGAVAGPQVSLTASCGCGGLGLSGDRGRRRREVARDVPLRASAGIGSCWPKGGALAAGVASTGTTLGCGEERVARERRPAALRAGRVLMERSARRGWREDRAQGVGPGTGCLGGSCRRRGSVGWAGGERHGCERKDRSRSRSAVSCVPLARHGRVSRTRRQGWDRWE
jgi:hypothetical protein